MIRLLLALFVSIMILLSCNSRSCPENLNDCIFSIKPDSVLVNIQLTNNAENPSVRFELFKSYYEGNNENRVYVGETFNENTSVLLPPAYYTVKAIYNRNNDTVWVFNRGRSRVITYDCDFGCYDIKEPTIDVRLK